MRQYEELIDKGWKISFETNEYITLERVLPVSVLCIIFWFLVLNVVGVGLYFVYYYFTRTQTKTFRK